MVLQEPHQVLLVVGIGREVVSHRVGAARREAIVEALVVAVVKTLRDQIRFAVPIGLGDEEEVRVQLLHCPCDLLPIGGGTRRAHPVAPRLGNDVVEQQHRHVAPHPVALVGDLRQGLDHRRAQGGLRRVELDDVGPRGEVRIPSHCQHTARRLEEGGWIDLQVRFGASHEVLGVRPYPGMVGRDVVGDEVEEEAHAPSG